MTKLSFTLLVLVGAIAAAVAGFWLGQTKPEPLTAVTLYPQPKVIEPFQLVDKNGDDFEVDDWRGGWDLVFFGFTHCPDICPSTLGMMRSIRDELIDDSNDSSELRINFVSVDPERDTPERLRQYVEHFDPAFQGITGDTEQLAKMARQLNIAYVVEEHPAEAKSYNVDHFAGILLINPDAKVHGIFTTPHDATSIAADLGQIIRG